MFISATVIGTLAGFGYYIYPFYQAWAQRDQNLFDAIRSCDYKRARLALEYGADSNARGMAGLRPLHWAVAQKQAGLIKLLMRYGADAEAHDDLGQRPIDIASNDPILIQALQENHLLGNE